MHQLANATGAARWLTQTKKMAAQPNTNNTLNAAAGAIHCTPGGAPWAAAGLQLTAKVSADSTGAERRGENASVTVPHREKVLTGIVGGLWYGMQHRQAVLPATGLMVPTVTMTSTWTGVLEGMVPPARVSVGYTARLLLTR